MCSSSSESLVFPVISFKQHVADFTILSKAPCHQGALSMLNIHSTPTPAKSFSTTCISSLNTVLMNFAAALKVFLLLEINLCGIPLLAANCFSHLMYISVDMSLMISNCTICITQHVKRQIHSCVYFIAIQKNGYRVGHHSPHQYIWMRVPLQLWINISNGGSGGTPNSNLLQITQRWMMDLTKLWPFTIQYFLLICVDISLTPSCWTRLCTSWLIRAVMECLRGTSTGCLVAY